MGRDLTESSRSICRTLRDSPKTFGVLQRYSVARPEEINFQADPPSP